MAHGSGHTCPPRHAEVLSQIRSLQYNDHTADVLIKRCLSASLMTGWHLLKPCDLQAPNITGATCRQRGLC